MILYYISVFYFTVDGVHWFGQDFFGWKWALPWLGAAAIFLFMVRKHKNLPFHTAWGSLLYFPFNVYNTPSLDIRGWTEAMGRDKLLLPWIPLVAGLILFMIYFKRKKDRRSNIS